jgi:hypothetical protein
MHHVNVKVFASGNGGVRLSDAIPVFHRWIQRRDLPELLIDVADYSHVLAGPGVILIAHEANYSLDERGNRLGLLYSRKIGSGDSAREQLRQAHEAALAACRRLEQEPEFQGRLKFNPGDLEAIFNDRLLHPNTTAGWEAIRPDVEAYFATVFGAGGFTIERDLDSRSRLRVSVRKT